MLIIGCGDIGLRVAQQANPERELWGVVRSDESSQQLSNAQIHPLQCNLDNLQTYPDYPPQAQWLYTAPPPRSGQIDTRLQQWLTLTPTSHIPARITYISTSGVYGDRQGNWVTEDTPVNPQTDRAIRRLDAEQQLRQWCQKHQCELIIMRVPGITGPDRLPLERLRSGEPLIRPEQSPYTNLVDADFLAHCCLLLAAKAPAGIYNISDRPPIRSTEHSLKICTEYNINPPPFISFEDAKQSYSPIRMSFLNESRRLKCDKLNRIISLNNN